jgi:hypothetical protein
VSIAYILRSRKASAVTMLQATVALRRYFTARQSAKTEIAFAQGVAVK